MTLISPEVATGKVPWATVMETLFLRMSQLLPFVHIILELHNNIGVGLSYQRAMGVYALLLSYQILGNLRTTLFTLNGKTSKIP